jgi:hypothetical protein
MFNRLIIIICILLAASGFIPACGGADNTACSSNADCVQGFEACFQGQCSPLVQDSGPVDTGILPDTVSNDPGFTQDTTNIVDVSAPSDLTVDITPPSIVSITPAEGATTLNLDVTVTVKFSEPIKFGSFGAFTFEVQDIDGHKLNNPIGCLNNNDCNSIEGTVCANKYCVTPGHQTFSISADKTEVTFHPDPSEKLYYASPYTVTMTTLIKDLANNSLEQGEKWTFFTRDHLSTGQYAALAQKFAPQITQGLKSENYIYDIPTRMDLDGDWNVTNNDTFIKAATTTHLAPAVYWSVVETKSHYFIAYQYYWSLGDSDLNKVKNVPNDSSGAMVMVAKSDIESPELLVNYFATGANTAEMPAFAPLGSPLSEISHNVDPTKWFKSVGPNRPFETYVASAFHTACDNDYSPDSALNPCFRTNLDVTSLISVRLTAAATATNLQKSGNAWVVPSVANYELVSLTDSQWPRRLVDAQTIQELWDDSMSYNNLPEGRPGEGLQIPNAYILSMANHPYQGRPIWAWKWKSAFGNGEQTGLPRGMAFLDPAWFTAWRHIANKIESNVADTWDPTTQTGFSLEYCFNPYLNIDLRGSDVDCNGL